MPVSSDNGGTSVTGNAVLGFRAVVCIHALRTHLKFNGKLRLSRNATPSNLVAIASEFTGKRYSNRRKGLEAALRDLEALQAGKSLDEMGDTSVVNREVGGIAADLQ